MTSVSTSVTINPAALAQLKTNAGAAWANQIGRRVVNAMQERCPVDEGRLRASLTYTVSMTPNTVILRIGSPLDYATYVVRGTGIYGPRKAPIRPVHATVLKFPTPKKRGPLRVGEKPTARNRGFVFAKEVKGRPRNMFMIDGLKAVLGEGKVTVHAEN